MKITKIAAVLLSAAAMTGAMPVMPFTSEIMQNVIITAEAASTTTTPITSGALRYDIIQEGSSKYAVVNAPTDRYLSSVSIPGMVSGGGHYNVPVRKIGAGAFAGSRYLTTVNFAGAYYLTEICEYAFASCGVLNDFTIPSTVTTIGAQAFANTKLPSTVNIGADLTSINTSAFINSFGVEQFKVSSANPNYKAENGVLYTKNGSTLLRYPDKRTATSFTTNATTIPDDAISGNNYLRTLSISKMFRGGTGKVVFSGLNNLENLTIPQVDFNQSAETIFDRYSPLLYSSKINKINGQKIVLLASNGKPYFGYKFSTHLNNSFEKYSNFSFMNYYIDKMATYVVNSVTNPSMTQMEKARALHDWILDNTTYDPLVSEALRLKRQHILIPSYTYETEKNHVNASVFLHQRNGVKYTVCDGYSRCYKILLNKANIECDYVFGKDNTEKDDKYKTNHAWNRIKIDGDYYFTDVTWDDTNYDKNNGSDKYQYFMKSESWFKSYYGGHSTYDWEYWQSI